MQRNLQLMMNVPEIKLYSSFVFVITVLYYCHVSRRDLDNICFLSTIMYFNFLVFWTVQLQSSNIRIYYYAIFINAFFHAVYTLLDKVIL